MRLHHFSADLLWRVFYGRLLWFMLGAGVAALVLSTAWNWKMADQAQRRLDMTLRERLEVAQAAYFSEDPRVAIWELNQAAGLLEFASGREQEGEEAHVLNMHRFLVHARLARMHDVMNNSAAKGRHVARALDLADLIDMVEVVVEDEDSLFRALGLLDISIRIESDQNMNPRPVR